MLNNLKGNALHAYNAVIGFLSEQTDIEYTSELFEEKVNGIKIICPLTDDEANLVVRKLEEDYLVKLDKGQVIEDFENHVPWVLNRKKDINWYFWDRYRKYLQKKYKWPNPIVNNLDAVTDEILDLCGDPQVEGSWRRKGLILGDIQSGKTSNYIGLMNKAADAGYGIIILLAGMTENLREQTQDRVDAGFVGACSKDDRIGEINRQAYGVGEIDNTKQGVAFTTVVQDFNRVSLESKNIRLQELKGQKVVFVLKKNKKVLENLHQWLKDTNISLAGGKINTPLLFIDDEADNASINTNKEEQDPTAINKGIVNILKLFDRFTYVGVTATPFANIFTDTDDKNSGEFNLFPNDFIYALGRPSKYIGVNKIFAEDAEYADALEVIDDLEVDIDNNEYVFRSKARKDHVVPKLPRSLIYATDYFLLFNVIQDLRDYNKTHRSMLVNVSQYNNVQEQIKNLIQSHVKDIQYAAYEWAKKPNAMDNNLIQELHTVWMKYHLESKTKITWDEILMNLYDSISSITTKMINMSSRSDEEANLDYGSYKEGLRVIAVGGYSLSRGLTLEGLAVSYFDRTSKMYDTLMQMGRWFGYRTGYEELFKIWMSESAIQWYSYIGGATEELRNEIIDMSSKKLKPIEFGLRVEQDQRMLFVTANNKRRYAKETEKWISLANQVVETPVLIANREALEINLKNTNEFLTGLLSGQDENASVVQEKENRLFINNVSNTAVSDYIAKFITHPDFLPFDSKDLAGYILEHNEPWRVVVYGGSMGEYESEYFDEKILEHHLKYARRVFTVDSNKLFFSGKRHRVGAPGATKVGLDKKTIEEIERQFKKANPNKKTVPDKPYLMACDSPILMIYIAKINDDEENLKQKSNVFAKKLVEDLPVIGLGLGFPGSSEHIDDKRTVKYLINKTMQEQTKKFLEFTQYEEDDYDEED